jgi:dipeptidyl aminopeptidase/acylaminoacyl peptidase
VNPINRTVVIQVSILATLLVAGIATFSVLLAESAMHPSLVRQSADPPDLIASDTKSAYREAQIKAADGTVLDAWLFLPERPHPNFVMVLHGVGDTRAGMHRLIRMLLRNGYAVLAPNSRTTLVTYGVLEAADVHLWADYLYRTHQVRDLYGLGESMGAAVVLQALPLEPRFSAVVADSPFSTFTTIGHDRIEQNFGSGAWPVRMIAYPIVSSGFAYARLKYGVDLSAASPLEAVRHTSTPILLIHGLKDANISPQHSRTLLMSNPRHITPWFVPKAAHAGAFSADPAVYEQRVITFFEAHQH